MDAFHNLLREANSRNNAATNNGLSTPAGLGLGLSQGMTSGLPMGMSLPMPMNNLPGAGSLAPIHRMNPLMAANTQMFANMNGGMPGMAPTQLQTPAAAASASTTPSAAAGKGKTTAKAPAASKKRKAPASSTPSIGDGDDSDDDGKQPEEYEDPKAKRRAQIAKAARKHRQRQKDELIALRSKVKDLKEQIEVLQSSEPSEHNTELGWKQEAEQHAEIRARVDQENEFLRKTLMEQMKFIQRLQDYFTKQPLLNMPSLDLILNSSGSTSTTPAALSNTITASSSAASSPAPSSALQLASSSFQDQLRRLANDAMSGADKALLDCENAFRTPKNPTMTYFGLEVQYEMSKTEMGIFFRHHIYNCDASAVVDDIWECVGNASFEKKFPFMESVDMLDEIDPTTKYVRRVVNLTMGNESGQPNGTIKEESLVVVQKRENPDGSIYFITRSVKNDPSHPKPADMIRRNQTTSVSLRNFSDANGTGCLLLWSVKVLVDKDTEDRSKPANIPDIILKNLFEITPVYVKAIVDRARGIMQHS